MCAIMSTQVRQGLRLLQSAACARILLTCAGLSPLNSLRNGPSRFELQRRLERLERQFAGVLNRLSPEHRARLRLERALFLRLLQESAAFRLQFWSDRDALDEMPASHLFEWVAHDDERMELAQIESAMTPEEKTRYACAMDEPSPFL
jgi:hypothetical protein